MSRRSSRPAKYEVVFLPDVLTLDLPAIAAVDAALLDGVAAAVDDLAHGRQRGKALGERHVSGDLTGLLRLRFDVAGRTRQHRYRIVYRHLVDETVEVMEIVAVGERSDHDVYRVSLARVPEPDPPSQ